MTFRGQANFRTKMLTFTIAGLPGAYHAILGRPCYVKFMAIPNYAYFKLKLLGPHRTITMNGDLHQAYSREEESLNIAVAACQAPKLQTIQATTTEVAPGSSTRKESFGTFTPTKDTKAVWIDHEDAN